MKFCKGAFFVANLLATLLIIYGCGASQPAVESSPRAVVPSPAAANSSTPTPTQRLSEPTPVTTPAVITWRDAANYLGEVKTIEGTIVRTYWASKSNGKPTFLNFNNPYQGYLTCLIWEDDRGKFPANPEKYYLKKTVQVTGLIKSYQDAPEIVLTDPSQIKVLDSPSIR